MSEREWLRERVLESQRASRDLSAANVEEIKRERAARYARAEETEETSSDALTVLAWVVGEERLGLEAREVVAVIPARESFPLPLAPSWANRVIAFRGEPVVVVSFRQLMGLPEVEGPTETRWIVVRWRKGLTAIQADHVDRVFDVPTSDLEVAGDHGWLEPAAMRGILPGGLTLLALPGLAEQLAGARAP